MKNTHDSTESYLNFYKWCEDHCKAVYDYFKKYLDIKLQEHQRQEALARLPLVTSEMFYFISNYVMPHNFKFDCQDESFLKVRMLTPALYDLEVPIRNLEKMQPYTQLLFEKALNRQFTACVRQLQLQCGDAINAYFHILPNVSAIKVYQTQPGLVIIRINLKI